MDTSPRLGGLDGVRALAVTLVLLVHVSPFPFVFGWVGVQIFFVLSGFLITRVLLNMKRRPLGSYLKTFYARRTLRIFPVYYAYLATLMCGLLVMYWLAPTLQPEVKRIASQLPYAITYTYNIFHASSGWSENHLIAHFWSLAAEEQFYLIWPLLVYWLPRKTLGVVAIVFVVLGPFLRLSEYYVISANPEAFSRAEIAIYTFPLSHIDAFATGALLVLFRARAIVTKLSMSLAFAIAVGAGPVITGYTRTAFYVFPMADGWQFIWGYTVVNLLGLLVIKGAMDGTLVPRFFNHPWTAHVGKVSYGLYIFHLPIAFLLAMAIPTSSFFHRLIYALLVFCLSFMIAHFSFTRFEKPILSLKDKFFP